MNSEATNFYNPSNGDTKNEFENLRSIVEHQLGEFRPIVILGVTDIVLWILKCDHQFNTPTHKRAQLEKLLNPFADQVFEQMLQTTQRITDYSIQDSGLIEFYNDVPLTSMENIVAYNLLIRVYQGRHSGVPRPPLAQPYKMVLILNNQSAEPIDYQKKVIGDLADSHLLVFIISKLFPDFVRRWDGVAFNVGSPSTTLNGEEDHEVDIDAIMSMFLLPPESEREPVWDCLSLVRSNIQKPRIDHITASPFELFVDHSVMGSESPSYLYKPTREDTKTELENLRNIVEHRLGAFRPIVIVVVTDIVLWILKSDHRFKTPIEKRVEVEKLLNPIADQVFEQMLLITQRVNDYQVRFKPHDGQPITIIPKECMVVYNLLIRVYRNGDAHQKKAFEMLLILMTNKSFKIQRDKIRNLFDEISDPDDCDLLMFIITKLFPNFVRHWEDVAFRVIPAVMNALNLTGYGGYEESEDLKVIDTLPLIVRLERHAPAIGPPPIDEFIPCSLSLKRPRVPSEGFEESQNKLGNAGASASREFRDHHQRSRDFYDHDRRQKTDLYTMVEDVEQAVSSNCSVM
ncbi:hypothetical protein Sjap_007329 [Stephania japonica]|uniref:Uncharacterized protein n=1 Tax=Stephania japonica TaxID=461633 RepID=A0AAP0PDM5_9MAGN